MAGSSPDLYPQVRLPHSLVSAVFVAKSHRLRLLDRSFSGRQRVCDTDTAERGGDVVHALQSPPECFRSRLAIRFAAQETSETGDHADQFAQRRLFPGWRLLRAEDDDASPLVVVEHRVAGQIRGNAANIRQMMDPPGHDGVDGET